MNLNLPAGKLIDISLPLDARTFHMRTYSGFKKDMQFEVEVIKAYEDGGYGQIVRGAHMRLHAGTHVDAPSHMIKGAPDLEDVPLSAYFGDAIIADVRHRGGGEAITPADLEKAVGDIILPGRGRRAPRRRVWARGGVDPRRGAAAPVGGATGKGDRERAGARGPAPPAG